MKCWRDLSKDCVENDCPMWMTGFNLSDIVEPEELGLNENKCALVYNEKIGVMKQMLDVVESMRCSSDLFMEDFFGGMEPEKKPAGPKPRKAQAAKKSRAPAKNPPVKGTQLPLR